MHPIAGTHRSCTPLGASSACLKPEEHSLTRQKNQLHYNPQNCSIHLFTMRLRLTYIYMICMYIIYIYTYIYICMCIYIYIYINRVQRWFEFIGETIEFFLDLLRCSCVVAGPGVGSPWSASNGQAPRILPTTNWEYDWEMLGIPPTISN